MQYDGDIPTFQVCPWGGGNDDDDDGDDGKGDDGDDGEGDIPSIYLPSLSLGW